MAKKPETKFWENVVKPRLEKIPNLYFRKIQQVSVRGVPDVLICYRGRFFAFELKVPPNKVKKGSLQWLNLELILKADGVAREVTPDNFEACMMELLDVQYS